MIPKFRAWHKPTQLMDDVVLIDFYNEKIGILYADPVMQCESIQKYNFNEVELMQYTGLKDKNGKEIYEGDIVKTVYKTGCVEYCEKQARYNIYLKSKDRLNEMNFMKNMANECEVIGNIYENPDIDR